MKQLLVAIVVLFVLKRYNHVKCTTFETFADNACGIICIHHVKCTPFETFADND